jgi:hypothetical protein
MDGIADIRLKASFELDGRHSGSRLGLPVSTDPRAGTLDSRWVRRR